MDYIVRYRASSGSPVEEVFSASNKAELFQLLKDRHISAISVRLRPVRDKKIKIKLALISFLIIIFACSLVLFWQLLASGSPQKLEAVNDIVPKHNVVKRTDSKLKEVKSAQKIAPSPSLRKKSRESIATEKTIVKDSGILFESSTNATGVIVERFRLSNGNTYRRIRSVKMVDLPTVSDQLLALATSDELADAPPIPVGNDITDDDNFAEALKKDIIISDKDSEEIKALKLRVKSAREAMLKEMAAGMTFGEVIAAEQRMAREDAKTLREAQALINKALKDDKQADASRIYEELSKTLLDMGIEGLTLEPDPDDISEDEDDVSDTADINDKE